MPRVTVLPSGIVFPVRAGENILAAITRAGHTYHFGCRRGGCAECKADIVSGTVSYERRIAKNVLSDEERGRGVCLTCRAVPIDDVVLSFDPKHELTCKSRLAWDIAQRELTTMPVPATHPSDLPT